MSEENREHTFGTGERGKYARRRPPRDGETVRLIVIARLTWHGTEPGWPRSGNMTATCGGNAAMVCQAAGNLAAVDFSHPDRAATALKSALELGHDLPLQRDDATATAHILAIHRLAAQGDSYVSTATTVTPHPPDRAQFDRLSHDLTGILSA